MRLLICAFALLCLVVMPPGTGFSEITTDPEGKMLVELERAGGEYVVKAITIVHGAAPPPFEEGETAYRIADAGGSLIRAGRLRIPRNIYHCKADESGKFTGFAEPIEGPVVVTLPYYSSAASFELTDGQGRRLLRERLRDVPKRALAVTPAMRTEELDPPDFRGYLSTLSLNPLEPVEPGKFPTPAAGVSPADVNVTGKVNVRGKGTGAFYASIYFYRNANDEFVASTSIWLNEDFNVSLPAGTYLARVRCWYYDPAFGDDPVQLYPFPLVEPGIKVGGAGPPLSLTFTFDFNNLFIGTVRTKRGSRIPATVYILDKKKARSVFQRGLLGPVGTNASGEFAFRLPSRKYAFVVVPWHQDVAGELLTIKSVASKGNTLAEFTCPAPGKLKGKALKQIWPGNLTYPPGSAPQADGKLNILFMAEAYTKKKERFTDSNGNGRWDGDLLLDENGNGKLDPGEYYYDRNRNGQYDVPEKFKDKNKDGICNRYERAKFELDCLANTASLLNTRPFLKNSKRINVYTYWVASKHGVQRFSKAQPWKNMNTFFGSSCNGTGGFQSGAINSAKVYNVAASVLPDYTVPIVLVHDPFNAMRSNAFYNFGRVLQSAEDTRGGATLIHELGHSIGFLGDEYVYTEGITYRGGEPSQENLTTVTNPNKVKWRKYIKGSPPVPTPFGYDGYGIFEGGAGGTYRIYRPTATSLMRNTNYAFLKVNVARLKKVLKAFKK